MYFRAKVEDGCIRIPEELLMFFETGDEVDVSTALIDDIVRERHRLDIAERKKGLTIEDMRDLFNAIELAPEDAKYNREELHRRGSSARKHLRYGSLEDYVGRGEKMFPNGGVQEYIRALRDDDRF